MKKLIRATGVIIILALLACGLFAQRIFSYRNVSPDLQADAAIVLGAAVWGEKVSPVFRERLNHAVELYKKRKVRKLIFTGGRGNTDEPTESFAARQYAVQQGVPAADTLIEEKSHSTFENLVYAKQVADKAGLKKVLIVSDPLHMKRGVEMARDVGMDAYPSPTPSSRYKGVRSQLGLLAHETYFYMGYLLRRTFLRHETRG